jgi:hypothetical protein
VSRRTAEGLNKNDIIRRLTRFVAGALSLLLHAENCTGRALVSACRDAAGWRRDAWFCAWHRHQGEHRRSECVTHVTYIRRKK